MRSGRVTAMDVARLAGVSQSAVSRTFTPGAHVSKETRASVLKAARLLGYKPNALARSLITQRSNLIGLVMGDITNPFYPRVMEIFSQKLQHMGCQILLFTIGSGQEVDDALPQVLQYQVDGIIITSANLTSTMAVACQQAGTPVVLFNRSTPFQEISSVCSDNVNSARQVAELLHKSDHRRFAYIAGKQDTSTNVDREKGYIDRLRELGVSSVLREKGDYSYESGYQAALKLLGRDEPPDAIFCANDLMAMAALDVAKDVYHLKVPEDISIIGFDDIPPANWPGYKLTTVRQQIELMVDEALDVLLRAIRQPDTKPIVRTIPTIVIERSTARIVANQLAS